VAVVLGFLIVRNWPGSSSWAIGTIVGVNLCVSGVTRLAFSVSAGKALKEVPGEARWHGSGPNTARAVQLKGSR